MPTLHTGGYPATGCHLCVLRVPAVQEERQRSRERAESEAECAGGAHEGMPVERILEAELAVEPKTESYGDMSMESSVCVLGAGHPLACRRRWW